MRILVTGGAGFIGSHFTKHLIETYPDYHVTVLDALTYAGNINNFSEKEQKNPKFSFCHGDIRNKELVRELVKNTDAVVHFAAETHVDRSLLFADDFITTDVYGTFVLLEAAREFSVKRFVHISTDEVYGEAEGEPCTENSPLFPKSPYAASKAGADRLVHSYFISYGTPAVISRCVNNYGPFQFPEKMLPLFITNALEDKTLPVYGTGKNTREWIHARDHCKAIDRLLHEKGIEGEIFNIGTGDELSIVDIARMILKNLSKPEEMLSFVEDRPGHVQRHAVNSNKIHKKLNWQPEISFEKGIEKTVEWYCENKPWWKEVKNKQEYKTFHSLWYEKREKRNVTTQT